MICGRIAEWTELQRAQIPVSCSHTHTGPEYHSVLHFFFFREERAMKRFAVVAMTLLTAVFFTGAANLLAAEGGAAVAGQGTTYSVPGYWMLAQDHVQKEIGLTDEQKVKLKEISDKYREQVRQGYTRQKAVDWQKLSDEERKQKVEEMRARSTKLQAKRQKMIDTLKKQVEKVLTEKQIAALKQIGFEQRAGYMLRNSRVLEALDVSEKQKSRLEKNAEQFRAKMRELQKKSAEKALGVLTEEQLEKLRAFHEEGYRSLWSQAKSPASCQAEKPCDSKKQPAREKDKSGEKK